MLTKTLTTSPRSNKWNSGEHSESENRPRSGWNFRVISAYCGNGEFEYAIHEVYYNEAGEPASWSSNPAVVLAGEPEGVQCQIDLFQKALEKPWLMLKTEGLRSWLEEM